MSKLNVWTLLYYYAAMCILCKAFETSMANHRFHKLENISHQLHKYLKIKAGRDWRSSFSSLFKQPGKVQTRI